MSDFKKLIEAAALIPHRKINEAKMESLPADAKRALKAHQKSISVLAKALKSYNDSLVDVINTPVELYVPDFDDVINYESGADKVSPIKEKASDGSFMVSSKNRDISSWEKITTKAIDVLLREKYEKTGE